MGYAALKLASAAIRRPELSLVPKTEATAEETATQSVFWLATFLIILQILDGLLTGLGMSQFGLHAEGNPLLKELMVYVGYIPALAITKGIAIAIIAGLATCAGQIKWLGGAMKAVIALYLVAAIIPWTYILTAQYLLS